jgi:hypothetical protein
LDRRQFQRVFGNLGKHFHLIMIRPGFLYGKRSISAFQRLVRLVSRSDAPVAVRFCGRRHARFPVRQIREPTRTHTDDGPLLNRHAQPLKEIRAFPILVLQSGKLRWRARSSNALNTFSIS